MDLAYGLLMNLVVLTKKKSYRFAFKRIDVKNCSFLQSVFRLFNVYKNDFCQLIFFVSDFSLSEARLKFSFSRRLLGHVTDGSFYQ